MHRTVLLAALYLLAVAASAATVGPTTQPQATHIDDTRPLLRLKLEAARHLTIQLPGMSHHFSQPTDQNGNLLAGREFNEQNWGLGLQLERAMTGDGSLWVTKTSVGVMKDSLNAMGLYAGHTWQKRVHEGASLSADAGGGAFLFYRTLQFNGSRKLVPALLPVLSTLHRDSGLGLNLVLVPRLKMKSGVMPGVIYLQFTKAF